MGYVGYQWRRRKGNETTPPQTPPLQSAPSRLLQYTIAYAPPFLLQRTERKRLLAHGSKPAANRALRPSRAPIPASSWGAAAAPTLKGQLNRQRRNEVNG